MSSNFNHIIMNKKYKIITLIVTVLVLISALPGDSRAQEQHEPSIREGLSAVQDVPEGWESLFDGKTLTGWKIVPYSGGGEAYVKGGSLILPNVSGGLMTAVCWIGDSLPENNYVIYYEARRVTGTDIFAALTFPYGDTFASLIFGGWYGTVNGLSSIDGYDASENETTQYFSYNNDQWYPVQLHVTTDSIRAMVGTEKVVDLATKGKYIHLRDETLATGFTLWSYRSTGEIRNLRIKKLPSKD